MKKFTLKFAAIFIAAVLSGCSAGAGTEPGGKPATTTAAETSAEEITSTAAVTTTTAEITTEVITSTSKEKKTAETVPLPNQEEITPLEIIHLVPETDYSELEATSTILMSYCPIVDVFPKILLMLLQENNSSPTETIIKGWGCYPSAFIKKFEDNKYPEFLIDLTGCEPETMYNQIDNGLPVAVWVTSALQPPVIMEETDDYKLYTPNECYVMVGHSTTHVMLYSVIKNDYFEFDKITFEKVFEELGSMALTVNPGANQ
ncbi:MAG: hypothetical protein ACI4KR_05250 [Ruminiclostridium sp.]